MYEEFFPRRLAELRSVKGISARDMSLSIGQNPGYINAIENGKAFPTMASFFYICEFLGVTPQDFFDTDTREPGKIRELTEQLKLLDEVQLDIIATLVDQLVKNR